MRFWWVNHKQTFEHEVGKGYVWCPKRKKDDSRNHFYETRNDDIHNGLALSRNVHWAFDRGLWSVDDQFRILIKPERFQEWGPDDLGLATYRGRMLQFAPQATLRPRAEYLRRHRQQWGF